MNLDGGIEESAGTGIRSQHHDASVASLTTAHFQGISGGPPFLKIIQTGKPEFLALEIADQLLDYTHVFRPGLEIGMDAIAAHDRELLHYAKERFSQYPYITLYTPDDEQQSGGILSFAVEGVHPHDVATIFDSEGVAIRAGLHCAEPLIRSLGLLATARMSFHVYNTREDIDAAERALQKTAEIFKIEA